MFVRDLQEKGGIVRMIKEGEIFERLMGSMFYVRRTLNENS